MKVQEVCAAGDKDACEKIKYTASVIGLLLVLICFGVSVKSGFV